MLCLTFKLTGQRRQEALARPETMYRAPQVRGGLPQLVRLSEGLGSAENLSAPSASRHKLNRYPGPHCVVNLCDRIGLAQ